jgi:ArsR family transcriptional regulator
MDVESMDVDMSMAPEETRAIRVAKALGDPTRFRLLRAIAARDEVSCQELTALFPVSQATVSHHLKVLSDAGLVSAEHRGPYHYYRLVPGALDLHGKALGRAFGRKGARSGAATARRAARERTR